MQLLENFKANSAVHNEAEKNVGYWSGVTCSYGLFHLQQKKSSVCSWSLSWQETSADIVSKTTRWTNSNLFRKREFFFFQTRISLMELCGVRSCRVIVVVVSVSRGAVPSASWAVRFSTRTSLASRHLEIRSRFRGASRSGHSRHLPNPPCGERKRGLVTKRATSNLYCFRFVMTFWLWLELGQTKTSPEEKGKALSQREIDGFCFASTILWVRQWIDNEKLHNWCTNIEKWNFDHQIQIWWWCLKKKVPPSRAITPPEIATLQQFPRRFPVSEFRVSYLALKSHKSKNTANLYFIPL